MNELNILILNSGRRVELIECFKNSIKKLNIKGKVIACDCSNLAPALYFADKMYKTSEIFSNTYIDNIIEICLRENISLIIPTIDTDLLILSKNKNSIEKNTKAKLLISNSGVIKICRDKILTQEFLENNNFDMPKIYEVGDIENGKIDYPIFVKPKDGSSSINAFKVNNRDEFMLYRKTITYPIFQEYILGDEYTIDVFLDFKSKIISIVPRLRIATRSGEILKGKILKHREIIESVNSLMKILKPIGHITVQLIKTEKSMKYIEINPRFGGGAPMSIFSGADSCEFLLKLLNGSELNYTENYEENLTFLRFDNSICLNEKMELL